MDRSLAILQLSEIILQNRPSHPLRVAIDGVDAAGKTSLADELVKPLQQSGRCVIRASADSFQNPRAIRRQRGEFSPEGFYRDSYNYAALETCLLEPLGPGGNLVYTTACFDLRKDAAVDAPRLCAAPDAILLVDGIFLLRPELRGLWDFSIFVQAVFETTLPRALLRDQHLGSPDLIRERYLKRYIPGQLLYLKEAQPEKTANTIIVNDTPEDVTILVRG